MLCEKCGKNNATVMYTQIINGQKSVINLCSHCAAGESIFDNFGSLLSFGTRQSVQNAVCPICKMTLSEFARKGKAGCGECYNTFRAQASAMLKKIHGTDKHITTDVKPVEEKQTEKQREISPLEKLKAELKTAIFEENFEEAAKLRDKIREIEVKGGNE